MSAIKNAPSAVVGIDIGSDTIKVAEAKYTKDGVVITGLGMGKTPEGTIESDLIIDPKTLGQAVKAVLVASGIKTRRSVSSVAGQSTVVVRVIEIPKTEGRELAETVKYEVERQVPFSPEEIEMDYATLDTPAPDPECQNMEVLLAVARREMVDGHLKTIEAAGLKPDAIDVEALANGRALINLKGLGDTDEVVGIISIGARSTEVGFFDKGVLVFPSPPIGIAGANLTTEISQAMGMVGEQAESLKKEYAAVDLDGFGALYGAEEPTTYDTFGAPGLPYETPFDKELPSQNYSGPGGESSETTGYDVEETGGPSFDMGGETAAPAPAGYEPAAETPAGPSFDLDAEEPAKAPAEQFDLDDQTDASNTTVVPSAAPAAPEDSSPVFDMSELGEVHGGAAGFGGEHHGVDRTEMSGQVFRSIANVLVDLAREVRTSLEYYYTRYQKMPARIYLCGGTANIPMLDEFLSRELGVPVQVADPFKGVHHEVPGFSETQIRELAPLFCVSIGLAVRDMVE